MKKYISFLLQAILLFQVSANSQTHYIKESTAKSISVSTVTNPGLTAMMKSTFAGLTLASEAIMKVTGIPSFSIGDFDFVYLYKSEKAGEIEIAYSASYKGIPVKDKYAFTVFVKDGIPERPMLIRTSGDRSMLIYYDLVNGKTAELVKNRDAYAFSSRTVDLFDNDWAGKTAGPTNCGQAVMDCITDAYSRRGWLSVWVTIQSIFVPATGVGIALGCIAANCK